jgi:DNA topoisomerase-3
VSKTLIIAEKPSVAADIAKVVGAKDKSESAWEGPDHVVSWAVGHLLELKPPESYDVKFKRWTLKDLPILPEHFDREPTSNGKKQLSALVKLIARKDVDKLTNACDAGREGELIFREIYRHAKTKKSADRLWLQSMTQAAIKTSVANPRKQSDVEGLADAADCRAESDWLIGMNATRALTVRLRSKSDREVWSAGRVQTTTLAMAVRREREILAHEPEPYWLIRARFAIEGSHAHEYEGTWYDPQAENKRDRIVSPDVRDAIVKRLEAMPAARATETRKDKEDHAPPLFDMTSLQREGNKRFGLSARRVLEVGQSLYEARKLITYPRTASKALPEDYRAHVDKVLKGLAAGSTWQEHAKRLLANGLNYQKRNFNDAEVSDHFAIIPTGEGDVDKLSEIEARVYDLIVRRFLAAFHPPAIKTEVERITVAGRDSFRTTRSVLKEPGWRAVFDREAVDDEKALPPLPVPADPGTPAKLLGHEVEEKETTPPARLTEASLLSLMETAGKEIDDERLADILHDAGGIGTPATRADILETLLSREYLERCQDLEGRKTLRATPRGIRLIEALERIQLPQLTSPELTANLEAELRDMEHGKRGRADYMAEVRDWTKEIVERVSGFSYDTLYDGTEPLGMCPTCGTPVREMLRVYQCKNGGREGTCQFVLWKETSGRWLDRRSAAQLLEKRETPPKAGFFTRTSREYQAMLKLDAENRVSVVPRARSGEVDAAVADMAPLDIGPCPFHPDKLVRRSPQGYRCDGYATKECKLTLPLVLCQRPLTPEEITTMITGERKTPVLEGFISRKGRPFKASLTLSDVAKISWEFPPREAGARGPREAVKRKEFPVDPAPIAKCPKHPKAQVVETPTDFACPEEKCKVKIPRDLLKREITRDEAKSLLVDKETPVLEGFLSRKTGKTFSAMLKLNLRKAGGWEFAFPDR